MTTATLTLSTSSLRTDIENAQKRLAEREAAALKQIEQACKGECPAPKDLTETAALIAKFRAERDEARKACADTKRGASEFSDQVSGGVHSILAGKPIFGESFGESRLVPLQEMFTRMKQQLDAERVQLHALADIERANLRNTMADQAFMEMPGFPLYYVGDTPLLTAAEAGVVMVYGDRLAKENFLRRRGWIILANSAGGAHSWKEPAGGQTGGSTWPFDSAVLMAVKQALKPLMRLGTRDYQGIKFEKPADVVKQVQ